MAYIQPPGGLLSLTLASGAQMEKAVLRVGGGRGFVVKHHRRGLLVVTAAHCLPVLPPAHPFSYIEERTYRSLLGPLGSEPTVWAECLFADPIADIALLVTPDEQDLYEQAQAYQQLTNSDRPLVIADAPKMGRERVQGYGGYSFEADTHGVGMSGSPIIMGGRAIGVVSTDELNPVIKDCLPAWFFRR